MAEEHWAEFHYLSHSVYGCACDLDSFSSLFDFPPALADLQKADLVTSQECMMEASKDSKGLTHVHHIVDIQISHGKSPEVMVQTADILIGKGFEKESNFLKGELIISGHPHCIIRILIT